MKGGSHEGALAGSSWGHVNACTFRKAVSANRDESIFPDAEQLDSARF